jgi:hypothetical protein
VTAVISNVHDGPGREAVVAHGLVVEALREIADAVLPVRFGERLADRAALHAAITDRVGVLRERLASVRGCAEFGVRMQSPPEAAAATPASDGAAYLRARLDARARASAVAAELHRPLVRCARAAVVSPGGDHAAAYLVSHERRSSFEHALAAFMAAHPDVTVLCTGPWAPYSFVEAA